MLCTKHDLQEKEDCSEVMMSDFNHFSNRRKHQSLPCLQIKASQQRVLVGDQKILLLMLHGKRKIWMISSLRKWMRGRML